MPTPAGRKGPVDQRDLALENLAGNYFVAQYQASRLMEVIEARFKDDDSSETGKVEIGSAHVFKWHENWYRIKLSIEKVNLADL